MADILKRNKNGRNRSYRQDFMRFIFVISSLKCASCSVPEKICVGTNFKKIDVSVHNPHYGWADSDESYYANCTLIVGNLQLVRTDPQVDYNVWLQHIEEVTGYVLIKQVSPGKLRFPKLRIIRGESLFHLNLVDPEYALIVYYTIELNTQEIHQLVFPELREISNGSVLIYTRNPVCFIGPGGWAEILRGHGAGYHFEYLDLDKSECKNGSCDGICSSDQEYPRSKCNFNCRDGHCFGENSNQCCDTSCAAGCNGPSSSDCFSCKNVFHDGHCKESCPTGMYRLGSTCKEKCPSEFVIDEDDKSCLAECPFDKMERKGKCVKLIPSDKKCRSPSDFWPLIHSGNVEHFRNCSILDGSISLHYKAFDETTPHAHNFSFSSRYEPLNISQLEVFSTLRELTGAISIYFTSDKPQFPDKHFSYFRNLSIIGERRRNFLDPNEFGLAVSYTSMEVLDLRSLTSVAGRVDILYNSELCYVDSINWTKITGKSGSYSVYVRFNKEVERCEFEGKQNCASECFVGSGCWGPEPQQCQRCATNTFKGQCVDQCPSGFEDNEDIVECTLVSESRNIMIIILAPTVTILVVAFSIGAIWYKLWNATQKKLALAMMPLPNLSKFRTIGEEELKKDSVIGSGCFGTVYRGIWKPEENYCIPVAIKVLHGMASASESIELLNEAFIMASMTHPHVHALLAICFGSETMLVTQLMPLGSLKEYLERKTTQIGSDTMLTWCSQITMGMEFLESRRLVHRDLAARNVLVETPSHIKITDFGLTKLLPVSEDEFRSKLEMMPVRWLAVESLQNGTYSHKSDAWALGVTIWEILTFGETPYQLLSVHDVEPYLRKGNRLRQPSTCSIDLHMLLLTTWMVDPDARPTFSKLLESFKEMLENPGQYVVIPGEEIYHLKPPEEIQLNERALFRELAMKMDVPQEDVVSFQEYLELRGSYYCCPSEDERG